LFLFVITAVDTIDYPYKGIDTGIARAIPTL